MPELLANYVETGKVRYVLRDFPLGFHKHAAKAHEAAHCAGDQGKYWERGISLLRELRSNNCEAVLSTMDGVMKERDFLKNVRHKDRFWESYFYVEFYGDVPAAYRSPPAPPRETAEQGNRPGRAGPALSCGPPHVRNRAAARSAPPRWNRTHLAGT